MHSFFEPLHSAKHGLTLSTDLESLQAFAHTVNVLKQAAFRCAESVAPLSSIRACAFFSSFRQRTEQLASFILHAPWHAIALKPLPQWRPHVWSTSTHCLLHTSRANSCITPPVVTESLRAELLFLYLMLMPT